MTVRLTRKLLGDVCVTWVECEDCINWLNDDGRGNKVKHILNRRTAIFLINCKPLTVQREGDCRDKVGCVSLSGPCEARRAGWEMGQGGQDERTSALL